jgi:hypothetical protein
VPINQEDMAGTIIGFSLLVVDGLLEIGLPLAPEVAEDYYYIWRVFGHLMGLRYPGAPDDIDCLPQSLDEARAFYRAYARHYVGPTDYSNGWRERALAANPDGVALADAHVLMLGRMFGKVLSGQYNRNDARRSVEVDARGLFGKGFEHAGIHLFEKTIHQLIGDAASARIGVDSNAHGSLLGDLMGMLPSHLKGVGHRLSPELAIAFSKWIFQHLVRGTYPGDIVFPVPLDVEDLHELAKHGD